MDNSASFSFDLTDNSNSQQSATISSNIIRI
jgi:hypothetical protein